MSPHAGFGVGGGNGVQGNLGISHLLEIAF